MVERSDAEALLWSLLDSLDSDLETMVVSGVDAAEVREALGPLAAVADLRVEWTSINVERVDMCLRGEDREWRLVYFLAGDLVSSVSLYEKPAPFERIAGGVAVVVNGPSGAGKSSLIQAVADADTRPWVVFDEPWLGWVKQPYLIWPDTAPVLHRGFPEGIAALAAAGNPVILSSGGVPFGTIADVLANVWMLTVGLDCQRDLLLERERGRAGRWGGLAEASLHAHDGWRYDLRLDSSTTPPAALAQRILDAIPTS